MYIYICIPIIDLEFRSIKPEALDVRSSIIDTVCDPVFGPLSICSPKVHVPK